MIETVIEKAKIHKIDALIGGFHLVNPGTKKLGESEENVIRLAEDLKTFGIGIILTGHCTGIDGYEIIKKHYDGCIVNITTGFEAEIPAEAELNGSEIRELQNTAQDQPARYSDYSSR